MSAIGDTEQSFPRLPAARDGVRLILETALDAVVIMKSDGVVADWNDRATSIFEWSRDEAVGRTMADLIIPERYREAHRNGLQRYFENRQGEVLGKRIEVSGIRKNGEEFLSSFGSYLLITVEDSGTGIDPVHIDRIFNPFFTTKSHGMGMGLSICRSIIENHGGRLSVSLGQPYGSIFHVFLPTDPSVRSDEGVK